MIFGYVWQDAKLAIPLAIRQRYTFLQKAAANHCKTLSSVPLAFPCLSSSIPFSRLFLCSSFLFLSSSFPFTDLRFTSTKPSDRPPKCDRYPLLGSNAKTLSLDNGSHIYILHVFNYFHIPKDLWILSTAIIEAYKTNMTTWPLTVEHDGDYTAMSSAKKLLWEDACDMGQTAPHIYLWVPSGELT